VELLRSAVQSNGAAHMTATRETTSQSPRSSVSTHYVDQPGQSPRSGRRESILDTARQIDRSTGRIQNPSSTVCPGFTQPKIQTSLAHVPGPKSYSVACSSIRSLEHITLSQERINQLFQTSVSNMHQHKGVINDSSGILSIITHSLVFLSPP
jgi:hypothetical protein